MVELVPQTYFDQLDLVSIFGRKAPLHVDLGCGDGDLLCELARRSPEQNFLGTEKLPGRVAKSCRKSANLNNVRVLNVESAYAVRYLLPPESVDTFYLLFPDPWPKRRHHRRRIVQSEFFMSIDRALEPGGTVYLATDDLSYFQQMERIARATNQLECIMHSSWGEGDGLPETKFERRFRQQRVPIYRLSLRKISPVT